MRSMNVRIRRRSIVMSTTIALILGGVAWSTGAAAHPTPDKGSQQEEGGLGVTVNSPEELAGFMEAVHSAGTAPVDGQTADLVYAGTGCSPASYVTVATEIQGNIALVDSRVSQTNPADVCPTYTFLQKVRPAQHAGAIGFVQIPGEGEDPRSNATAVTADIPALEVFRTDYALEVRDAAIAGTAVNATLTPSATPDPVSNVPCVDGMAGPFPCDGVEGWTARVRPAELSVEAGDDGLAAVRIGVPDGAAPGTYSFIVTATSTVDPSVSASEEVEVIVREGPPPAGGRR